MVATSREKTLPSLPPRGNHAGDNYVRSAVRPIDLPSHLIACADPQHDGVCIACGCWITIGSDGTEYGHARKNNRDHKTREERGDCDHRPTAVDPTATGDKGGDGE